MGLGVALTALALAACSSSADSGAGDSSGGSGVILTTGGSGGSSSSHAGASSTNTGGSSVIASGGSAGSGPSSGGAGGNNGAQNTAGAGGSSTAGAGGAAPVHYTCTTGLPSSVSDLQNMTSGSTVSQITKLGTRYDDPSQHIATSDDLAFFADPQKEPVIPGSTSGLHLAALQVTLYPSSGGVPIPADINQHAIGNCDGDTAFASIAYQNPDFIKSLITDNHDDTYTVKMYDPLGNRLTISLDNQFLVDGSGNIGAVSGKKGEADWATVLEKATMKYIQVYPVVGDIGGIGSEHQTPMFTGAGNSFAFDRGKLSPADLTRVVKASLAAGKLISGGFGIEGMALANGFQTVTAHGYAVFVPKDANTMISMRNPWGLDPTSSGYNGSTDGVLDIPADPTWSGTIDLRIIDPGDACGPGMTVPYLPSSGDVNADSINISQPHAR